MATKQTRLSAWFNKGSAGSGSTSRNRPTLDSQFGSTSTANRNQSNGTVRRQVTEVISLDVDEEDDEAWLAIALEVSEAEHKRDEEKRRKLANGNVDSPRIRNDQPSTSSDSVPKENYIGFDEAAGKIWIYPTNFPIRNYQFEIIRKALFYNTLVTLPTGLGKTFIAAVVMYNFYRWYPTGKVIFMAPTKPLVSQQMEACYNVMGIPQEHMTEMTGNIAPANRKKLWDEKRVFFLTPQVINNDLHKEVFQAETVKCLVIDEAHKATGEHAYCQVVRKLIGKTKQFRVLALSATPGSDLNAVQAVLSNLLIAHMELRDEDSPEIKQYTHTRNIECIVVPVTGDLAVLRDKYEKVLQAWLDILIKKRVFRPISVQGCSLTSLLAARAQFRTHPPAGFPAALKGMIEGAFANAIGLLHGYSLLSNMGMKSLYSYLQGKIAADKSTAIRRELNKNLELREIYEILRDRFSSEEAEREERKRFPNANESFFDRSHAAVAYSTQQVTDAAATSHPKLVKLVEILIQHFNTHGSKNTRVMVFAQYRDCVEEITELLKKRRPLIRPMKFVGQTSSRGMTKGISQKEQLEVVKKFKEGGYNTLVSTSVGEEGLDIGEVDLIVCYDATFSPVRSVQRMGRTGRKRAGRIVMLVTEGKEQNVFNSSEYSKKRVHKAIVANKKFELYRENRRMVPYGLFPECAKIHLTIEKPYENMALRKRKENGTGGAMKRFTGSLSEKELNEWERDFKIRDGTPSINLLGEKKPFRATQTVLPKKPESLITTYLNAVATAQHRMQRSILVQPSSLRLSFVRLARACQNETISATETCLDVPMTQAIKKLCQPRAPPHAKRLVKKSVKNARPKGSRGRKGPGGAPMVSDSCQMIVHFKTTDFYTTSTDERLNLTEIFPAVDPRAIVAPLRCGYSKSSTGVEIPILTTRTVINAMETEENCNCNC